MPTMNRSDFISIALASLLAMAPANAIAAEPEPLYWRCLVLEKHMQDSKDRLYRQYGKTRERRAEERKAKSELEAFREEHGESNLNDNESFRLQQLEARLDKYTKWRESAEQDLQRMLRGFEKNKTYYHETFDCTSLEAFD